MQKNIIKNINLYLLSNKFNQNLEILKSRHFDIKIIPNNYSIYKYVYSNDITNNSIFIFNSSIINEEINNFISFIGNRLPIYILIDSLFNKDILQNTFVKYIELPKYLINTELYSQSNLNKANQIVYFYEKDTETLNKISELLYPKTNLPIKIFNSIDFEHPLNLGFVNEYDKKDILYESEYYLHGDNSSYLGEAVIAGCKCLNIDSKESIQDQIKNYNTNINKKISEEIIDYASFLKELFI
jgi:hypothetical protein